MNSTRLPFEPLANLCLVAWREPNPSPTVGGRRAPITDVRRVADVLGVNRRAVYRWQTAGLTIEAADRMATALGLHPLEVWPDFHDDLKVA